MYERSENVEETDGAGRDGVGSAGAPPSCIQYSYLFINKNKIYGITLTRPKNKQRFYIKGKDIRFGSFENSQLKELGYIIWKGCDG